MLPTVLLHHTLPASHHYDWLLVDPRTAADPAARLWTARVNHPSSQWASLTTWDLQPLPPHRRHYLTYEGPIGPAADSESPSVASSPATPADRGSVQRIDEGHFIPHLWQDDRFLIDLAFRHFTGQVEATRITPTLWHARILHGQSDKRP